MKRLSRLLPFLCTLLLLAVGAYLPLLTTKLLDYRLENEVTQRKNTSVTLDLWKDLDFYQILQAFPSWQTQITLTDGFRMLPEKVISEALKAVDFFNIGFSPSEEPEVTPLLMSGPDTPGLSAILWKCIWTDLEGRQTVLWLDDANGLMVSFQGPVSMPTIYTSLEEGDTPELFAISGLTEYCRLYYPSDNPVQATGNPVEYSDGRLTLRNTRGGKQVSCTIPLRLSEDILLFNY